MSAAEITSRVLLQLAVILLACRAVRLATTRVRQPAVIAEMVAGFLLGPSLLGWVAPSVEAWLFPAAAMPILYALSQIGLTLYMFTVGLEFRGDVLRHLARRAVAVSVAGFVVPSLLGIALALGLLSYGGLFTAGVTPVQAALFTAAAMSVTAFPVLARIISDRGIAGTDIGTLTLAAGAINDAAAWVVLAVVLSLFSGSAMLAVVAAAGGVVYVAAVLLGARRLLRPLADAAQRGGRVSHDMLALVLVLLAAGAWFTEVIGLHAVFGAFVLGVAVPKGQLSDGVREAIGPLSATLLVPLFFTYSGLNTALGLLDSVSLWGVAAVVFLTACAGKGLGCWGAARLTGADGHEAAAIAALMNARGMVELVLLNIALQRGLITGTLFTMFVLMAIGTTIIAGPLFSLVWERRAVTDRARPARSQRASP